MGILNMLYHMYLKFVEMPMGFSHSIHEEKRYLKKFCEPENDLERSYFQYQCQKWDYHSLLKWGVLNIVCGLMILPIQMYFLMRAKKIIHKKRQYDVVMTGDFIKSGYLPRERVEYLDLDIKCLDRKDYGNGILTKQDMRFLKKIGLKYPLSFYFYFKCMCRIASYSEVVNRYSPRDIYVSAEYSFTSSVLTAYCEHNGIRHINVMHGEKTFYIKDAFSRFHVFYVWDDFYIELFHKLRADKTKYITQRPVLKNIEPKHSKTNCTYYLQIHSLEELKRIRKALKTMGCDYKVRPHPIYRSQDIEKVFEKQEIEDPLEIDIWDSIENAGCVISLCSTVLLQAFWKGIPVVIDDISNPRYTVELRLRDYIMFSKEHSLLSDVLDDRRKKQDENQG